MKRLLKVTSMTGLLTLLRMSMGFIVAKVVAIYTGPTGMAMLGQVQSMVTSLNGIVNAPAGSGVVRYTAENKDKGFPACAPWWRASIQWILAISMLVVPIGVLFAPDIANLLVQDSSLSWIVIATVCCLPLSAVGTLCNSVINGQQLYRRYVGLGMLATLMSSAIMLSMIFAYNINGALLAAAVQSALIGLLLLILNLRQPWLKFSFWWGHTDNKNLKAIGGYMLMAITSALTVPVSLIIVRSMLVDIVGWEAAGHWQAVWKISQVYLGVITMSLSTYYLPRLSTLVGVEAIVDEINKTAKLIIPIIASLGIGVYVLRDTAITLLYTKEFYEARELFSIQLLGDVLKIASWLYAYPMLSRGATKWFVATEIISSFLFVVFSYIFISNFGVKGAPIAYLVNYAIYFIFVFFNVKKFAK